tara:strand:+ start:48 stop:503 length:456 start_codon:yes stop_codon:yes gene_type:complete
MNTLQTEQVRRPMWVFNKSLPLAEQRVDVKFYGAPMKISATTQLNVQCLIDGTWQERVITFDTAEDAFEAFIAIADNTNWYSVYQIYTVCLLCHETETNHALEGFDLEKLAALNTWRDSLQNMIEVAREFPYDDLDVLHISDFQEQFQLAP